MIRSLTILYSKYSWDKLFIPIAVIEAILVFLCVSSEHREFFIPIALITFIPLVLKLKALMVFSIVLTIILIVYFSFLPNEKYDVDLNGHFKVKKAISMGVIISNNDNNILLKTKLAINNYDEIEVKGIVEKVKNTSEFDLVTYLKSLNVNYIVDRPKINLLARSNDIRVVAKEFVSSGEEWYEMITPLIFLGEKTSSTKEIYNISLQMNVVHLFVISGFHISLLHKLVSKTMLFLRCSLDIALWLPLIPIWIYLFFLGFPTSALRAVLFTTFIVINKSLLSNKFEPIHIVSFVMALMTMWEPMSIYSLSFIFTFVATFVIVFIQGFEFDSKTSKYISIIIFSYLSNIVIVMYINHHFSVLGLVFGVVLTPVFVLIYMLSIFLFPFKSLLNHIDHGFVWIMKAFNQINFLINVPYFSLNYIYGIYGTIWSLLIICVGKNRWSIVKNKIYRNKWIN